MPLIDKAASYNTHMDVIAGFLVALVLVVLCVGFGVAVYTIVSGLLGSGDDNDSKSDD
ncbi:MAG: hypothetical protein JW395_2181 [Nitrospira sp.]|nr:hypothetical protein [Nitrospira sp.]